MEHTARKTYAENNKYDVFECGLIVSEKHPWIAYSPDGIVFNGNKPIKLLEIKCPIAGKLKYVHVFKY